MTEEKDTDGYPTAPRNIGRHGGWFYEEKVGILAYHDADHRVRIPWKLLTKAVDRHRRIQRKKRR